MFRRKREWTETTQRSEGFELSVNNNKKLKKKRVKTAKWLLKLIKENAETVGRLNDDYGQNTPAITISTVEELVRKGGKKKG